MLAFTVCVRMSDVAYIIRLTLPTVLVNLTFDVIAAPNNKIYAYINDLLNATLMFVIFTYGNFNSIYFIMAAGNQLRVIGERYSAEGGEAEQAMLQSSYLHLSSIIAES